MYYNLYVDGDRCIMKCSTCKHYIETNEYNECKLFKFNCFLRYNQENQCPYVRDNYKMTRLGRKQYLNIKKQNISIIRTIKKFFS